MIISRELRDNIRELAVSIRDHLPEADQQVSDPAVAISLAKYWDAIHELARE